MSASMAIRPLILLCISSFLLMTSHGLSGLLLPVRLNADGVNVQSIGLILSSYSAGFLLGAILGKKILQRIGLVRTFSMCGSLAATGILCMGLEVNLVLWVAMRALMGFSIACATATLDTWYNSVSTQSNRGKILAVNQIVILSAVTLGQFGLTIASPSDTTLFIIAGLLFSISITPLLFISQFEPSIESSKTMSLWSLFQLSPLGLITCLLCGVLYSTTMNMLPLYATDVGIIGLQLSIFMGAATAGGIILQLPVGYLSDRFERRKIILLVCVILLAATFVLSMAMKLSLFTASAVLVGLVMGIIACLYPLSISITFDRALSEQLVPALTGLLCVYAIGSIIGPYASSLIMQDFGNASLFLFMCA
ncbi:MAG: MFS transporter, partial [Vibrio sp.]